MDNYKPLTQAGISASYNLSLASSIEEDFIFRRLKKSTQLNQSIPHANYLIHKIFCLYRKQNWLHTASTKTKSEVRGGGRKPWPQKGRGRARAGSIRSPLWKGGGVCFGPKPKKLSIKVNHLEYDKAVRNLLNHKQSKIIAVSINKTDTNYCQTKLVNESLNNLYKKLNNQILSDTYSLSKLLIVSEFEFKLLENGNYLTSIRNIPNISLVKVSDIKFDNLLKANSILMTSFAAYELTSNDLIWKK
jgi:large subunit ribosomal protein L4